jgi:hypothetical protein
MEIDRKKKNYEEREDIGKFFFVDLSKTEMMIKGKEDVIIFHITEFEIDYYYY